MRIIEAKDYQDMSKKAAHILAAQVTEPMTVWQSGAKAGIWISPKLLP